MRATFCGKMYFDKMGSNENEFDVEMSSMSSNCVDAGDQHERVNIFLFIFSTF